MTKDIQAYYLRDQYETLIEKIRQCAPRHNVRVRAVAELLLQRTAVDFKVSDTEIWGVKCLHYELPKPLNYYNKGEKKTC